MTRLGFRGATAVATAALCGMILVLGAAPGLTWLDAGELGAAAWELGIAHPPGYPVFALGHKAVMLLLPVGDAAFRGNLASALLGAGALALLVSVGRRAGQSRAPLLAAALLVSVTPAFALHAVTIEVYTGVALFVAAWLRLLSTPAEAGAPPDPRAVVAGAFLVGLALGHHAELRLLALPFVAVAAFVLRGDRRAWAFVLAAALAGALVVLYLPLRAAAEPWRDWGHPATPAALWDHLMGARIRAAYGDQMGRLAWSDASRFAHEVLAPLGPALPLALVGAALTLRRRLTRLLLAVVVVGRGLCAHREPDGAARPAERPAGHRRRGPARRDGNRRPRDAAGPAGTVGACHRRGDPAARRRAPGAVPARDRSRPARARRRRPRPDPARRRG